MTEAIQRLKKTAIEVDWTDDVCLLPEVARLPFAEMKPAPYQGKLRNCLSVSGLDSDAMEELLSDPKTEDDYFFFIKLLYKTSPAVQKELLDQEELRKFLAFLSNQETDKSLKKFAIICILQIPGGKEFLAEYFQDAVKALYPGMQWGESQGREAGESLKRIQAQLEEAISLVYSILPDNQDSQEAAEKDPRVTCEVAMGLNKMVEEALSGVEFALSNSPNVRVQILLDNAKYILMEINPYAILPLKKRPETEFEAQNRILDMTKTTRGLFDLIEQGERLLTHIFLLPHPDDQVYDLLNLELVIFALIDLWQYAIGKKNFVQMQRIFESLQDLESAMEDAAFCFPWAVCPDGQG